MISKKADYEGWTNWETWNVALLIDNEERSNSLARQMAKSALEKRNRGQLNLDELTKQYARAFVGQERQVKKYHEDMAADARDERGKYEAKQLEGKPGLTKEEIAALPSEERVKYISEQLGGIFYDMGGASDWEKPMQEVNWKEIAVHFLDNEQNESDYQAEHNGETPEVNPLSDADMAELKAMGITGSKRAMITSDTQLETLTVPSEEAQKDDIGVNSHPANEKEGAPVLDGDLHHPERPNVNAMREAIETQSEMEVGKPIEVTQEEVKAEGGEEEVTVDVDKDNGGTQIVINISGKRKNLSFSNKATAAVFVKDASAKFGDKFKVVALFDRKVKLTPDEQEAYTRFYSSADTHSEYMGEYNAHWDAVDLENRVWEKMQEMFPRLKEYKGAKFASATVTLKSGDHISWHLHQFSMESRHGTVIDVLPDNPEKLVIFDAKLEDIMGNDKGMDVWGYMGLVYEINGQYVKPIEPYRAEFEVVQKSNSPQQDVDNNSPVTSGISDINAPGPAFKGAAGDALDRRENIEHLEAQDVAAREKKYSVYTGPTIVKQTAQRLEKAGFKVYLEGTEHVFVLTDRTPEDILQVLGPTWKPSDVQERPRRQEDEKQKGKAAASLPLEEYKMCFQLSRELGVSYGEAVTAFLQFSDKPLNARYEYARHKLQEEAAAMAKSAGFNYFFPGQVLENFYPEIMHETLEYPNATNAPMPAQMTGDAFEVEPGQLEDAVDDAFAGLAVVGYVSTSPAGGMGIARDGKPQVLDGAPLRKENDIRGPMFSDEFYQNYQEGIPGSALNIVGSKVAAGEEKKQFSLFLKKVMGEIAATFVYAFKCTSRMPLNKVPGVGEVQLAQIEKPANSEFYTVNTGSRVKYLLDKLTDSEIQDAINGAWSQGAVWNDSSDGGFVYEVFVRAETIDTESMIMKYKFVTGTKEAE